WFNAWLAVERGNKPTSNLYEARAYIRSVEPLETPKPSPIYAQSSYIEIPVFNQDTLQSQSIRTSSGCSLYMIRNSDGGAAYEGIGRVLNYGVRQFQPGDYFDLGAEIAADRDRNQIRHSVLRHADSNAVGAEEERIGWNRDDIDPARQPQMRGDIRARQQLSSRIIDLDFGQERMRRRIYGLSGPHDGSSKLLAGRLVNC